MGHRKTHAPHRGSLGYRRKRASSAKPRVRAWAKYNGPPRLEGFIGYKAGMTHVLAIEDRPHSHIKNTERVQAVTVLDTPPIVIMGIRAYKSSPYGYQIVGEVYASEVSEDVRRRSKNHPKHYDFEKAKARMDEVIGDATEVRAIVHTQPRLASVSKKVPDILEIKIGCKSAKEGYEWALELLGQEVLPENVFKAGDVVDVVSVTKGKGFQGPVKRHGIKILQHKSKHTKRGVGSIGPWHPARLMWTIPRAGNMGFERRTEYNKRIMLMGTNGDLINPKGGFVRYGLVRGRHIVVKGSVPGAKTRAVLLRHGVRKHKYPNSAPQVRHVSQESQMQ